MKRRDPKLARTAARAADTIAQARSTAVIREHGTEREQTALMFSSVRSSGITLTALAKAHAAGEAIELGPPEPKVLSKLTRRAERRRKLKLPSTECAQGQPYCDCLERALDQPGDEGKRAVLKLAASFHRKKTEPPRPPAAPDPEEPFAPPQEPDESLEELYTKPKPTPKAEPLPRPVRRTPKWYDPRPQSFRDMRL